MPWTFLKFSGTLCAGKDDNSDEDEDDETNFGNYSTINSVKLISRVFSDEVKSNIDILPARRLSHDPNWQMLSSNTPVIEETIFSNNFGSVEEESFDNSVFENDSISTAV